MVEDVRNLHTGVIDFTSETHGQQPTKTKITN